MTISTTGTSALDSQRKNIEFYERHYDVCDQWFIRPGTKIILGDKINRICRFCGKKPPEVTFSKVAHAIPEALGNKSIVSTYECDNCNEHFGQGIENDLGNWSKPMRTLARIRGKSGVPTLKKGGDGLGWRIEYGATGFIISAYESDPVFEVDEVNKVVTFKLKRDAYTPVAVLKAFMKIGLTLMPDSEICHFSHLLAWVCSTDHSLPFAENAPIFYTFQPGPMPNDLIVALLLRRKESIAGVPYAFFVLGYGNEVFQVLLPSKQYDEAMNGKSFSIPPFPVPVSSDTTLYGVHRSAPLHLTGREVIRGEEMTIQMSFNSIVPSADGSN